MITSFLDESYSYKIYLDKGDGLRWWGQFGHSLDDARKYFAKYCKGQGVLKAGLVLIDEYCCSIKDVLDYYEPQKDAAPDNRFYSEIKAILKSDNKYRAIMWGSIFQTKGIV